MLQGKVEVRQNGSLYFHLHLTLRPGRDDDLIAMLQAAPRGQIAATVRELIRCGVSSGRFSPDDGERITMRLDDVGLEI